MLYLTEGDYINAGLSALSIIPGADAFTKTGNPVIDNMQNRVPNNEVTPPNKRGNASVSNKDGKPIEIHHNDQKPKVDRTQFRKWKQEYWKHEWDNGKVERLE